jgi:hypothetical protein
MSDRLSRRSASIVLIVLEYPSWLTRQLKSDNVVSEISLTLTGIGRSMPAGSGICFWHSPAGRPMQPREVV